MLELSRTVRFCLWEGGGVGGEGWSEVPRHNTFAAWPPMRGLGRYYELRVVCRGEADATTGYFINIKEIDVAVRKRALPVLQAAVERSPGYGSGASGGGYGALLKALLDAVQAELAGRVTKLELVLTPTLGIAMETHAMNHVLMRQSYEFSAAHRLHVPQLTEAQNREVFGKCNNPAGHGHNYRVEVVVRCEVDAHGRCLAPETLDAAVDEHVIERLDHKHLNTDVPEFADRNPSVENIVRVVWEMLDGQLPEGVGLEEVSVWETGKTVCTYRGEPAVSLK